MANDCSISVKDAVHKLQLSLLNGIQEEHQLFAAGSIMSQSDYQDVVTERSIANTCGYPLCTNSLPSEKPRKGHYRISLNEHKVYDLHETYMYCSTTCVVNSRTFSGSLQEERCEVLNQAKLDQVMRLFEGLDLDSGEDMGRNGDLGLSELKIQEKTDIQVGEVSSQEWIGPSNAIEGYIPKKDRNPKPLRSKNRKEGSKPNRASLSTGKNTLFNEMDFMSTIMTEDEYTISKIPSGPVKSVFDAKVEESNKEVRSKELVDKSTSAETKFEESNEEIRTVVTDENISISNGSNATVRKSSLKSVGPQKGTRYVTWADNKIDSSENKNLCEFRESHEEKETSRVFGFAEMERDDKNSSRFESAEACALALSQAAEAVASGESEVPDAVSEAGIIIMPPPHNVDEEEFQENVDPEPAPVKWPSKQGISNSDFFDSEDSWYDSPPEGFSLTLSPFATMFMALFSWISSSSLAYIYGRDESFHEDYLSVNGREYPRKIILIGGRSSEIKQTLAGCLSRAIPGLVSDLRLPTPISSLEHGMGCLLDTMSFSDALPPFRMKQWQVIILLFFDALSISRIPALAPHMTTRRRLFYKVLDGAQISAEEYEIMKDVVIPLGRAPQLSTQSGG